MEPPDPSEPGRGAKLLRLAAHELRTPLSVVAGYLRMLQHDRESLTSRQQKMVDEANRSVDRLTSLIADVSHLAHLELGEPPLQLGPVDVAALVSAILARQARDADTPATSLRAGGPSMVVADSALLSSALESLVRAVVREQGDGAPVLIVVDPPGDDWVRLSIGRSGDEAHGHDCPLAAFDEWRGGLGLVLPMARCIIERHGGRVQSRAGTDGAPAPRSGIVVVLPHVGQQRTRA